MSSIGTIQRKGRISFEHLMQNEADSAMQEILKKAKKYSDLLRNKQISSHFKILLLGETGTGKSYIAQAMHNSIDKGENFVAINSAAIPETLLESEMFGYKKGAFSGANEDRDGFIHKAKDGALFFDEIGTLSPALQAKLLTLLDSGKFFKLGSRDEEESNAFIICATNLSYDELQNREFFRQDLLYRFDIIWEFPPLRNRSPKAIRNYIQFYAKEIEEKLQPNQQFSMTEDILNSLSKYHWPGNLRELHKAIREACINCFLEGRINLQEDDFPRKIFIGNKAQDEKKISSLRTVLQGFFKDRNFLHLDTLEKIYLEVASEKFKKMSDIMTALNIGKSKYYTLRDTNEFNVSEK